MGEFDQSSPTIGTVKLPSGRWQWTFNLQRHGAHVLFRHQEKANDEMMAWIPGRTVTAQQIEEAAQDPLHRVWEDLDGLTWRIALEIPTLPSSSRDLFREELLVVFSRGGVRHETRVPTTMAIGKLTCAEIAALMRGEPLDVVSEPE